MFLNNSDVKNNSYKVSYGRKNNNILGPIPQVTSKTQREMYKKEYHMTYFTYCGVSKCFILHIHRKIIFKKKGKMRSMQKEKNKKHDKMLNKRIAIISSFSLLLKGRICHAGWKTKTIKCFRDKAKQNNIS